MLERLRRQLQNLIGSAAALAVVLREADPTSLTPLDVALAEADMADLCGRLESLANRLANVAAPWLERSNGPDLPLVVPNAADTG
jgi:hypothetical protein